MFGFGKDRKKDLGLALGGGAARGLAHIGVLKVLERESIPIDFIAGTSFGAFVAALYAAGVPVAMMEEVALNMDWKQLLRFVDPVLPRSGLIDGKKISRFMAEMLPVRSFEELKIPLILPATEVMNGKTILFREGDLIEPLRAAIAFPGIFNPVKVGDTYLFDGGVCMPVPIDAVRALGAKRVIAVSTEPKVDKRFSTISVPVLDENRTDSLDAEDRFTPSIESLLSFFGNRDEADKGRASSNGNGGNGGSKEKPPGIFTVFMQALAILENELTELSLEQGGAELLIKPDMKDLTLLEFHRAKEAIAAGEMATEQLLPEIEKLF